LTVSKSFKLY
jgi:hypothetical protein